MTKAEIIKAICEKPDYRFTHDEMMRMSKKELLEYYPEYSETETSEDLKGLVHYPSYKKGYFDGRKDEREQMLKDAIEGVVFQPEVYYPKELVATYTGDLESGDKVKIIIVKEN